MEYRGSYRRPRVVCRECGWSSDRQVREDGTFGSCNRCKGQMVRAFQRTDRQIAKAKADLRELGGV